MNKLLKNKFFKQWLKTFNFTFEDVFKLEKLLLKIPNKIPNFQGSLWEPFLYSDPTNVKVIILGQSPYPKSQVANGLPFDVDFSSKALPHSLQNIIKELLREYNIEKEIVFLSLKKWAIQGVLLINITPFIFLNISKWQVTILESWSIILNKLIKMYDGLPMICWGKVAKDFLIKKIQHKACLIFGAHPSPLSAYKGFFNKNYFLKANTMLETLGLKKIDWLKCVNIKDSC